MGIKRHKNRFCWFMRPHCFQFCISMSRHDAVEKWSICFPHVSFVNFGTRCKSFIKSPSVRRYSSRVFTNIYSTYCTQCFLSFVTNGRSRILKTGRDKFSAAGGEKRVVVENLNMPHCSSKFFWKQKSITLSSRHPTSPRLRTLRDTRCVGWLLFLFFFFNFFLWVSDRC